MSWRDVPKPPGIAALELDERGYPIFFTVQPPPGAPLDFRALNPHHVRRCANEQLCAVCGTKLDYWCWFLGGPDSYSQRQFVEAPLHEACWRYTIQVCPYWINQDRTRKTEGLDQFRKFEGVNLQRCELGCACLVRVNGIKYQRMNPGSTTWVFKIPEPKQVIWFDSSTREEVTDQDRIARIVRPYQEQAARFDLRDLQYSRR